MLLAAALAAPAATQRMGVAPGALDSPPIARSLPLVLPCDQTFNVGLDTGTPVDDADVQVPLRFSGIIGKVTVKLGPNEL